MTTTAAKGFDATDVECATTIRLLACDMIQKANSGHPGLPLGMADCAHVLFTRFLKFSPEVPDWPNRDRFVLSGGHGSSMLYSLLHLSGYNFTIEDLTKFRVAFSKTPGHPEYDPKLGIEVTTGPLGQGFANAVGMALSERILSSYFGPEVFDHRIYAMCGDGDLMEGVSHEAASFAGHLGLERLLVLYDDNQITIDGPTDCTLSDDVCTRFAGYGWDVRRCEGNNLEAIDSAIRSALAVPNRPHLIACRTIIGLKSPFAGTAKVHGSPLGPEGLAKTKQAYNRSPDLFFHVPEIVRTRYAEAANRGNVLAKQWINEIIPKLPKELSDILNSLISGKLPNGWMDSIATSFPAGTAPMATRQSSQKTLDAIFKAIPAPLIVGGSADLTPSNLTKAGNAIDVARGKFHGNYVHYGVREHAMGSIMNGIATYGIRPYGATFFVFSDYMRPPIRAAAMMKLPVIFAFTHDSIGHGEDGPTHQPVEHMLSIRAIPGIVLIRPCDANEAAVAWKLALARTEGPTVLVFTKQEVPLITPPGAPGAEHGGYILGEYAAEVKPDVILLATGSEVSIAVNAQKILSSTEGGSIKARVVSLPSFEIFDSQTKEYRESVLPEGVPRIGIEAARTDFTWGHYGCFEAVGLDHYGASGSQKVLFETFGITAKAVVEAAKRAIANQKK